jgi:hypothetical protein
MSPSFVAAVTVRPGGNPDGVFGSLLLKKALHQLTYFALIV